MLVGFHDISFKVNDDEQAATPKVRGVACLDVGQNADNEIIVPALSHPSALGNIVMGRDKHFYSNGSFNLVQLVLYLLKQTGPAHVFISSYSIAEDSLDTLKKLQDTGDIWDIAFLIDNRVRTISPKPFDFLVTAFPDRYRCCALHAKVALIWNDNWHLSVVGSQNATHNPKLERGIIHTSQDIFYFDFKTLTHEFERGTT